MEGLAAVDSIELAQAALIYTLEPWLLYPIALYTTEGSSPCSSCSVPWFG
jgi:hypothetical protein